MKQSLIPITVITGFLGSGKTTLLNHLLENNQGVKFGVVVNDFGDINIDSQLVEKKTDTTLQLSNGCICCSIDIMGLEEALAQFAYPGTQIDYILIEASGLAESAELLSNLGAAVTKQLGVRLDGIVCVIDAENIENNASKHETAVSQIENANFIVINKVDLVNPAKLKDIKKMVSLLKPKARVFEATHGAIDMHLILDQEVFESVHAHADTHTHDHKHSHHPSTEPGSGQANHLHEHFTKMTFTADRPLDPIAFQDFVNNHIPTTVYRAKGFVDMGTKVRGMQCVFQLVGSRATITWDTWREMTPSTQLVFIGQDFDAESLKAKLAQCIDTDPSATTTADLPRTNT